MRAISALGQNFLISPQSIRKIVSVVKSYNPPCVLEVGSGKGALTYPLAESIPSIHCVEKDSFLASELNRSISHAEIQNVKIYTKDILEFDYSDVTPTPFHMVGSLPYNISKRIIAQALTMDPTLASHVHVVIQREVAESYTTPPPHADFLYHFAQIYSSCTYNFVVPKTHFKPIPEVDGAYVTFKKIRPPTDHKEYASFIKALYTQPRKTLKNNLSPLLGSANEKDIKHFQRIADLSKRPATLTHDELRDLFFVYNTLKPNDPSTT